MLSRKTWCFFDKPTPDCDCKPTEVSSTDAPSPAPLVGSHTPQLVLTPSRLRRRQGERERARARLVMTAERWARPDDRVKHRRSLASILSTVVIEPRTVYCGEKDIWSLDHFRVAVNGLDCVRPRGDFGVRASSNDSSNMNNTKNQRVSDAFSRCSLTDFIFRFNHDGTVCSYCQCLFYKRSLWWKYTPSLMIMHLWML